MSKSSRVLPLLVLALSAAFSSAEEASFVLSPDISSGGTTFGYGISRDGSTTLLQASTSSGTQLYLWKPGNSPVALPNPPSGSRYFEGLSGDGTKAIGKVGGFATTWTIDGVVTSLERPTGATATIPSRASFDGSYVVGYSLVNYLANPVLWHGGAATLLDSAGWDNSFALGVGDDGSSVGFVQRSGTPSVPCRWSATGIRTELPVPAGFTGNVDARDVSADGTVVLGRYSGASSGLLLWEPTRVRVLGGLPGFSGYVASQAISADGRAVIADLRGGAGWRYVLWDRAHGVRDLRATLIQAGLGDALQDVQFETLSAVTVLPSGAITVAGTAYAGGTYHGFVATLPAEATFDGVGDLDGGGFASSGTGLSADGQTVIGYGHTGDGRQAFLWTHERGLVGLGSEARDARGVSRDGTVVSGVLTQGGFRWNADGTGRWLGEDAQAEASSGSGVVTVGSNVGPDGIRHTYRWNGTSTERYETILGTHVAPSEARAVSADGTTFAGSTLPHTADGVSYDERAFVWDDQGHQRYLGDLPGGRAQSQALAISADGSAIVGWSSSANGPEAFRWTATGGMQGLGDLPGFGFASRALAISADGSLVVGVGVVDGENRAFLWDARYGMRDLKTLLVASGAVEAQAWKLTSATGVAIDAHGRIFVSGTGIDDQGRQQGFHASLPSLPAELRP